MKSLHKLLAALTVLAFILGYLPAQPAHALTIEVTNTNNDGPGSLRQAVLDAAPIGSGDTITFLPALAGQTILLDSEIVFGTNLTIDGSGLDPHIKISGQNASRIFNITGSYLVEISHVDIIDGKADDGGAINNGANTLHITDVNFSNNMSTYNGGALFNGGYMTITDSTFSNNSAQLGGAIYHFHYALNITNTTFSDNTVTGKGGAIFNNSYVTGMTVTDSTFSNNSAWELLDGEGGAIYNEGNIAGILGTTFSGNQSDKFGGAIYNNSILNNLSVSTLSGNFAKIDGGGIYNASGSFVYNLGRSTLSGNSADRDGGGILNELNGTLVVKNSTFSGNEAFKRGGGIMSEGALTVTNVTFSENGAAFGGGIAASTIYGFNLTNTILANSTLGGDCYNLSGDTITTDDHNLIETNSPTPHMCGNLAIAADPKLGPLRNNGFAKAKTHMLYFNSPALDAGTDVINLDEDQRGQPRPVDGDGNGTIAFDIGAVERQHTLKVLRYRSQAPYDGDILETGENSDAGGKTDSVNTTMKVGDNTFNQQYRSILSFDTNNLPDRAVVNRVIIQVKKAGAHWTNPFNFSDLLADIQKGPFSGKNALQSRDFEASASMNASSTFNSTPLPGGLYRGKLVPKARRYLNKKGISQFRLRFALDDNNNSSDDYILFYTGDIGNNLYRPLLLVRYYLP